MHLESALFFETPEQLYARVFRHLKPRTPLPGITVEFCRFANANSNIRLRDGKLLVRITDLLEGSPAPVQEALAFILLSKLYRKEVPRMYTHRYRLYLNRKDVRRTVDLLRQTRGRKYVSGGQGDRFNLEEIFEELNLRHFHGLMSRPELGWSRKPSRTLLGHYDASHNAIIISKLLDGPRADRLCVEYVMFHEMLHLRYPVEHRGAHRCVHTPEFKSAEKQFPQLERAKELLKKL